jgi:hypothetical protein
MFERNRNIKSNVKNSFSKVMKNKKIKENINILPLFSVNSF